MVDKLEEVFGFIAAAHPDPFLAAAADYKTVVCEQLQAFRIVFKDIAPQLMKTYGFKGITDKTFKGEIGRAHV